MLERNMGLKWRTFGIWEVGSGTSSGSFSWGSEGGFRDLEVDLRGASYELIFGFLQTLVDNSYTDAGTTTDRRYLVAHDFRHSPSQATSAGAITRLGPRQVREQGIRKKALEVSLGIYV